MFNWFKKSKFDIDNELIIARIERDLKNIKEDIEKIDIKAMEAQRSYRAKLQKLTEKPEIDKDKKDNVFLSPDGTPI